MTPKEKAFQLLDMMSLMPNQKVNIYYKQCALIAVDEIISVLTDINGIYNITPAITYWQEVKQEIEKL